MSHTTKTIALPKEWASFIAKNSVHRGHPGEPWKSIVEVQESTGLSYQAAQRAVKGMTSCYAITNGRRVKFFRP